MAPLAATVVAVAGAFIVSYGIEDTEKLPALKFELREIV